MDIPVEEGVARVSTDSPPNERNAPREATLLGSFDVFSLILNKMIGTGIYTQPTTVLLLTGDKQLSLILWAVGFVYTIMSMIIYLDYAAVFPYTGGEIVYIDEISSANSPPLPQTSDRTVGVGRRYTNDTNIHPRNNSDAIAPDQRLPATPQLGLISRILGDGLLAYTCYAFLFVGVFNSGTNCLQIGRETLIAIHPNETPNSSLVRFIGVFALMMICLIQLFSSRAGRVMNRFFALLKITFLIILFAFGCAYIHKHGGQTHFTEKIPDLPTFNYAQALLVVLYSYDGWENATFVAGEIDPKDPGTLRRGFIWAVAVVGILYTTLNVVFLCAIPYELLVRFRNENLQYNYAAMFSSSIPSAQRGWAIVIAVSSAGNANTVIYTFTRVKQSIGRMNLLPWSPLWKSDYEPQGERYGDRHKTPLGGILLEFIMTVIIISATAAVPGLLESINLPGNIQTIAHCFILIILGLGLFRLRSRELDLNVTVPRSWFPRVSKWGSTNKLGRIPQALFILTYAGMNSFIFVATGLSKTDGIDVGYSLKGKWYPTIVVSVIGFGLLYYLGVFEAYVPGHFYEKSLIQIGNTSCEIEKKPDFNMEDDRARRFGHRRTISMRLKEMRPNWMAALFWFFGGYLNHSPFDSLEEQWDNMNQTIHTHIASIENGFRLRRTRSKRTGSGEGAVSGEISREVSRPASQDENYQLDEVGERRSWAHGTMNHGSGEENVPRNLME